MGRRLCLYWGGSVGADQGLTRLFYDGDCGLCQGAVRFVARHDGSEGIRFAPLGGVTFQRLMPEPLQPGLPDSLLVLTAEGALLTRSGAVLHLLRRMGPVGRFGAVLLAWVPGPLRDWAYEQVARRRRSHPTCPRSSVFRDTRFEP